MNKVILTGNLARNLELKQTTSGKSVITTALAVKREIKDENGNYPADFIDIVVWGSQAEYLSRYGQKGDRVELSGRWQQRTWQDKNGNNRHADECIVESITVFAKRQEETQSEPEADEKKTMKPAPIMPEIDGDLPF